MGACNFETHAKGETAASAFRTAYDEAKYMHGHGGYTGTIAEKDGFVMARGKPPGMSAHDYVRLLEESWDGQGQLTQAQRDDFKVWDEKWGPALCIPVTTNGGHLLTKDVDAEGMREFIFCGMASE